LIRGQFNLLQGDVHQTCFLLEPLGLNVFEDIVMLLKYFQDQLVLQSKVWRSACNEQYYSLHQNTWGTAIDLTGQEPQADNKEQTYQLVKKIDIGNSNTKPYKDF